MKSRSSIDGRLFLYPKSYKNNSEAKIAQSWVLTLGPGKVSFTPQSTSYLMPNYIISTKALSDGTHTVHDDSAGCKHLPSPEDRRNLGWFSSSQMAVTEAKKTFSTASGCHDCAR